MTRPIDPISGKPKRGRPSRAEVLARDAAEAERITALAQERPAPAAPTVAGWRKPEWRKPSACDIIGWIETKCYVPEGRLLGRPFKLAEWQKDELYRIYDNRHGTRRAILSFGRKNGKSALAAVLLLVHLCGPMAQARPNSQLFSTAQSREQASLIFALAAKMVRMSPELRDFVVIRDSHKELLCPDLGTRYRALSAEASTAYGLSPVFIVHDELGQVRGPRSELYEALETATGAQENPLSIVISTQAPTDSDLLSILIDDALAGHDPRTVVRLYTADKDLDPFAEDTIKLANPAFGNFLNPTEVMAMAADAKRMPSREAEYRNLILNQRIQANTPFIAPEVWKSCNALPGGMTDGPVYAGLDLSETADLTALVMICQRDDERWGVHPTFWLPRENLIEKAVADRVPYDLWHRQGYLMTTPGRSISYQWVANYLREQFALYDIRKIAFDRWNFKHLLPWLQQAGMSEAFIKEKFVEFGQGMASMAPALRELESMLLNRKLAHGMHPVLSACVANTVIVRDDAGNRKPSKRKSTGRIDGLVALAMAVGVKPLQPAKIDVDALIG
jgi:phage terminase large subunit-like protein